MLLTIDFIAPIRTIGSSIKCGSNGTIKVASCAKLRYIAIIAFIDFDCCYNLAINVANVCR